MDPYRSTPRAIRRVVWCKRADETIVSVIIALVLGLAALAGAVHELMGGDYPGAIFLSAMGALGLFVAARFLDREAVILELDAVSVRARGLISRRPRARAQLDGTSEVIVAAAAIIGPPTTSPQYPVIGSTRVVQEFDVRIVTDDEEVTVARMRFEKDARNLAAWLEAERARLLK